MKNSGYYKYDFGNHHYVSGRLLIRCSYLLFIKIRLIVLLKHTLWMSPWYAGWYRIFFLLLFVFSWTAYHPTVPEYSARLVQKYYVVFTWYVKLCGNARDKFLSFCAWSVSITHAPKLENSVAVNFTVRRKDHLLSLASYRLGKMPPPKLPFYCNCLVLHLN